MNPPSLYCIGGNVGIARCPARAGRTSAYVRVWSRDGKQFVAPAGVRPGEVEQLFEELHARAPWAETGYSPELQREWTKRRTQFVTRVDARKALYRTRPEVRQLPPVPKTDSTPKQ